jgi:SAM-dependent methyltransferase
MKDSKHQDYIYINEDYYKNPKETFVFLKNIILRHFNKPSVLDIGCARGEFLFFLKKSIDFKYLSGIDYSSNLIEKAKGFNGLSDVNLSVDSAEEFELDRTFDVITMLGVLSYFDSVKPTLQNIKKHLTPGGKAFILGFFNDSDVDVQISYRNNKYFNQFESGWNFHSLQTIKKNLSDLNMTLNNIETFELSFNLSPQSDPCRAWHIDTQDGRKYINGLGLIYDIRVLEIANNI